MSQFVSKLRSYDHTYMDLFLRHKNTLIFSVKDWGVEDPRITWIDEIKKYAITYTAYSPAEPSVSLALTEDFVEFERMGSKLPAEDKDAAREMLNQSCPSLKGWKALNASVK